VPRLPHWFIWNFFKQLTHDILDRSAELRYDDIDFNFRTQVVEKMKMVLLN
jgi:hypothetical protein